MGHTPVEDDRIRGVEQCEGAGGEQRVVADGQLFVVVFDTQASK